jgi:WS/DGAT/MGAT family acyltransferase
VEVKAMAQDRFGHRLTVQDSAFVYFERDESPMHLGSVGIYEGRIPFQRFVDHMNGRIRLIPRYRQRLMFVPFNIAFPTWEDDPDFDILDHIHRVSLPPPGDDDQLARLASELWAPPLSRTKPLWELFLIEDLSGDRTALLAKVHHCMIDGVSGIELLMAALDISPEPSPPQPEDSAYAPAPITGRETRLLDALFHQVDQAIKTFADFQQSLVNPRKRLGRSTETFRDLTQLAPLFTHSVPKTPFNAPLSGRRSIVWSEMPFDEIRGIRRALGGTVNDVALTIVSGALQRYLQLHGQSTDGLDLRVMTPVNIRREDEKGKLGNRISAMFVPLPVGISDPVERAKVVRERVEALKEANQARAVDTLLRMMDVAPVPLIATVGSGPWAGNTLLNLVCTNVPGPMIPLYCVGHRLLAHYPLVPLTWELGIAVGITSYDQTLYFAFTADAKVVPDVKRLKEFLDQSFLELRTAAGVTPTDLPVVIEAPAMGMPSARETSRARAAADVHWPGAM